MDDVNERNEIISIGIKKKKEGLSRKLLDRRTTIRKKKKGKIQIREVCIRCDHEGENWYKFSVPKMKLSKILLGYRVKLSTREKVDLFCFFRAVGMVSRMWVLINQIRVEDGSSISRLKEMYTLIYQRVEFYRKDRSRFTTPLALFIFRLLFRQMENEFLMSFEETRSGLIKWSLSLREINIKHHRDFAIQHRELYENSNQLDVTLRNIQRRRERFVDLTLRTRQKSRRFRVALPIILGRSILLFALLMGESGGEKLLRRKHRKKKKKNHEEEEEEELTINIDHIMGDADLSRILSSIYRRNILSKKVRMRKKKKPFLGTLIKKIEKKIGRNFVTNHIRESDLCVAMENKVSSRVVHLANIYEDSDLLFDYRQVSCIRYDTIVSGRRVYDDDPVDRKVLLKIALATKKNGVSFEDVEEFSDFLLSQSDVLCHHKNEGDDEEKKGADKQFLLGMRRMVTRFYDFHDVCHMKKNDEGLIFMDGEFGEYYQNENKEVMEEKKRKKQKRKKKR